MSVSRRALSVLGYHRAMGRTRRAGRLIALALGLVSPLTGCGGDEAAPQPVCEGLGEEACTEALLGAMSLEEKVEQMHGSSLVAVDGIYHTPDNPRLGIAGFGMVDGPRGVRAGHATAFPVAAARGASWDRDLERRVGEAIGAEAAAKGANVILAPTMNVLRHPAWGRAQETYGEDPTHIGAMAVAFIEGAQEHVLASAKHFAANSIEDTRLDVDVTIDERTLREVYLPHFERAVREGHVGSVMSAYNSVNGAYCSENATLLRDILKGEWQFEGFVESDWLFAVHSTTPSALAGLDVEMPAPAFYGAPLLAAARSGEVPSEVIDDAVRRGLRQKLRFGVGTPPPFGVEVVESAEHRALAREAAQKSIVLLENRGGALPLDETSLGSLAVVGSLASVANLGDRGSSAVTPTSAVSPLEGLETALGAGRVTHVGLDDSLSAADIAAVAAADAAVVVVGLTADDEGESLGVTGGDRDSLGLSASHQALIAAVAAVQPRTIVVLEGGSAVTVQGWSDSVAAILMAFYPGQEGGHALADLLLGVVAPSGKLPVTFPVDAADLPPFDHVSHAVTYDAFHGYRRLDRDGTAPLYPFGHGLSYTTFDYGSLTLDAATVGAGDTLVAHFELTNSGTRVGEEVVELYVRAPGVSVERAVRVLAAFERVPLAPGASTTVTLEVPIGELAYWNVADHAFALEPGSYTVEVGRSSRDLPLQTNFSVTP